METKVKRQAAILGGRIGFMFLIASGILVFVAYFVLSHNFQKLLTEYTIKLVEGMVDQGVTTIEYELRTCREEVESLAESFTPKEGSAQDADFPVISSQADVLRIVYVSEGGTVASDGRTADVSGRRDIKEAFGGETAVYGPYFNEDNEYVICYSSPVVREGQTVGVLSVEKDGYYFCDLIKDIRFVSSGESYIINEEGTDIAVSNLDHIEWVNDGYNAEKLLEKEEDPVTRSVLELEEKGRAGESGTGTYYWDDSLCYLAYEPIPSVNWVLLAGLRQEEIDAMTQSVLYSSITEGPALSISIAVFLILTIIIIFWIVTSMKKNAEIAERLNVIANYDSLTGIMNRNCYHTALDTLSDGDYKSLACIYIDVNGLHEINNHLGHQAGDEMLKAVADVLGRIFPDDDIYRIGGDEFVVFCKNQVKQDICFQMGVVRQSLEKQGYSISVGIEWRDKEFDVNEIVNVAEEAMQQDKRRFYQGKGEERQIRTLNKKLEKLMAEKQDADTFLSILAPEFTGVYFVDLGNDTIRHLYIPPYFEEMLKEADDVFSKALRLYTQRIVAPQYHKQMEEFCDYGYVMAQLDGNATPELMYQKTDGSWLKLRILKFKTYTEKCRETLWIFSNMDQR